jgi:hypothetical protein
MKEYLDWSRLNNFSKGEFIDNVDYYTRPDFLYSLQDLRNRMGRNKIFPSPVEGSFVRLSGDRSSHHFADPVHDEWADAGDIFCEGIPIENLLLIYSMKVFGGIGVYFDTFYNNTGWVMFHLDKRPMRVDGMPLIWFCTQEENGRVYHYPQRDKEKWKLISIQRMYNPRWSR